MKQVLTLIRRELGTHFLSLTGYVVITTVLLLLGFSMLDMLAKLNGTPTDVHITEIFYSSLYFWLILLLTTPVITMRTFALEKYSGTFETLMTTPVSDFQVVLAKFIGSLLFYLITWLPLVGYITFVGQFSRNAASIEPGALFSTFLGILLVGCLYISMGCFASAISRSQLIAAAVSYGLGLTLFLLSLRSLVPIPARTWEADMFAHISMSEHMQDFARGIVDSSDVVYYLSLTALFLFLTQRVVESRRWK